MVDIERGPAVLPGGELVLIKMDFVCNRSNTSAEKLLFQNRIQSTAHFLFILYLHTARFICTVRIIFKVLLFGSLILSLGI